METHGTVIVLKSSVVRCLILLAAGEAKMREPGIRGVEFRVSVLSSSLDSADACGEISVTEDDDGAVALSGIVSPGARISAIV